MRAVQSVACVSGCVAGLLALLPVSHAQVNTCVSQSGGVMTPTAGVAYHFNVSRTAVGDQPDNTLVNAGATANLALALAPGNVTPPTYQWRKDGQPLINGGRFSGVNSPSLTIANTQPSDFGVYDCLLTATCGSVVSAPAALALSGGTPCPGDASGDRAVNFTDISTVLVNFGNTCP